MHLPQQILSNQPQLFNLQKAGDTDPLEYENEHPDISGNPTQLHAHQQYLAANNPIILQPQPKTIIMQPQHKQISNPIILPLVHNQQIIQPLIKVPQQQEKVCERQLLVNQDANDLQESNPLAYFEYLQKKYMNQSPDKENKENIPREYNNTNNTNNKEKKQSPIIHKPKEPSQPIIQKKTKNFDTAYTQFAEKIYNNNNNNNNNNQSEIVNNNANNEEEQYQTEKGELVNINELLLGQQDIVKIQKKNAVIKKNNQVQKTVNKSILSNQEMITSEQKQLEQCTFAPKINNKQGKRRTINEFIENQKQFQLQVEEKKIRLKEQIEQEKAEQIQKPQVSKKNEKNKSVYERLYQKANESNGNSAFQSDSQYMPQIGEKSRKIHRNERIENLLYQDALRRQEMQKLNAELKEQQRVPVKRQVCGNTNRILIQRFLRQFEQGLNVETERIDYLQLSDLLQTLGFLQLNPQSDNPGFSNERTLLYEIWYLLHGDQFGGILKRNLCILLLAIQGLYCNFPTERENAESATEEEECIGYFNQETQEWEVTQEDARMLQAKFDLLYRTKLQNEEIKKQKPEQQQEQQQFQPKISDTSKILAEHYRERLLQETASLIENNEIEIKIPSNGRISHTDLLVIQRQAQLAEHQKRFQQKNEEEISYYQQISQCNVSQLSSNSSQHRTLELYKLAKPQYQRTDRSAQEIEYEKSMDACTFQPAINKRRKRKACGIVVVGRSTERTIERMRLARKERELLNQWKQRGVPSSNIITQLNSLNEQFGCYQSVATQSKSNLNSFVQQEQEEEQEDINNNNNNNINENNNINQNKNNNNINDGNNDDQRVPLLFVDVNLGPSMADRIVVYEGDSAEELAEQFANKHELDDDLYEKLVQLLNEQIRGLLAKIDEEEVSEIEEQDEEDNVD